MDHDEMVALIRGGIAPTGGVWADLGAGTGNFTWALAELLGPDATIHALDRDAKAVAAIAQRLRTSPTAATILPRQADVTRQLDLPTLDGMLLANLLHFLRDQEQFMRRMAGLLAPGGRMLVVEYEQKLPIPWVPFPMPLARLTELARTSGFHTPVQVGFRRSPSSGRALYAAALLPHQA